MAKLSHKLTLNQMQLLAYAIYSAQQDGKTKFNKHEFEKKFNLGEYRREEAKEDSRRLFELGFSLDDLETGEFDFLHVFQRINYKDGLFTFKWSEDIVPHILDLKDRYVTNGFLTIANFKSGFSWILYDYLKGLYGHWRKYLSKDALMSLFCVEDKKTYQKNTGRFKQAVLDLAIKEINEYTEIEIRYKEKKEGRSIVGFDLQWSAGEKVPSATKKQIQELKTITDAIADDMFKYINLNNPFALPKCVLKN
jgi:plasmid replication initiation protein